MPRPRYSIACLLVLVTAVGASLAIYKRLNPPPAYPLPIAENDGEVVVYGQAFDESHAWTYVTRISSELIAGAPIWDRRRSHNPPLSANEAIVKADRVRLRLMEESKLTAETPPTSVWHIQNIELVPFDMESGQWYWLIRFWYGNAGWPYELAIIVLMDGTVVEPTIKSEAKRLGDSNGRFQLPVYELTPDN